MTSRLHFRAFLDGHLLGSTIADPTVAVGAESFELMENGNASSVWSARERLEQAMTIALARDGPYPETEAAAYQHALNWRKGAERLIAVEATECVVVVDEDAAHVLPELVPVRDARGASQPMDARVGFVRTIDHVGVPEVHRHADVRSLAVLYQAGAGVEPWFEQLANLLWEELHCHPFTVERFPGTLVDVADGDPQSLLERVFHRHHAVVFLGHHRKPGLDGAGGAWMLTGNRWISIAKLGKWLQRDGRGGTPVATIPEVVIAGSCRGAWLDPPGTVGGSAFYPREFLGAGVNWYLAPWMDVIAPAGAIDAHLRRTSKVFASFLRQWDQDRTGCVAHLHRAKREVGFHLGTSLFQLYAGGAALAERTVPSAEPDAVRAGSRLGAYELDILIADDPWARVFVAHVAQRPSERWLVQVLEPAEGSDAPVREIEQALHQIRAASPAEGHLVPDRIERLALMRNGAARREVAAMLYRLDEELAAARWSTLAALIPPVVEPDVDHFERVLRVGVALSEALARLHAAGLAHGNVGVDAVLVVETRSGARVLLKDAWLARVHAGRFTRTRYVPPQDVAGEAHSTAAAQDCWALGVILYELACGMPPFADDAAAARGLRRSVRECVKERFGDGAARFVPDALDRVVTECLAPAMSLRPAVREVAERLPLGLGGRPPSADAFACELETHLQAGCRLFVVPTGEFDDVEASLRALASVSWPSRRRGPGDAAEIRYHLLVAIEGEGLRDPARGLQVVPWPRPSERGGTPPDSDAEVELGARAILAALAEWTELAPPGHIPIVLIRGNMWWDVGPETWRQLARSQDGESQLAFVVADRTVMIGGEIGSRVTVLPHGPSRVELFQQVLAFAADADFVTGVSTATAAAIAAEAHPCSRDEMALALRTCALRRGVLDSSAVEDLSAERARRLATLDATSYLDARELEPPSYFALPPDPGPDGSWVTRAWVDSWVGAWTAQAALPIVGITTPPGCGKTALAHALAARLERPLVRVNCASCLRGGLGESEAALRQSLGAAGAIGKVVVLLDDVDRLFVPDDPTDATGAAAEQVAPTLLRMSAVLLRFLDIVAAARSGVAVAMTATRLDGLSAQWLRRPSVWLSLPSPVGTAADAYRAEVFAARFRSHRLDAVARDEDLVLEIARATDPVRRGPILTPVARAAPRSSLGRSRSSVRTPADIDHWIADTLLLHVSHQSPESAAFWRAATRS